MILSSAPVSIIVLIHNELSCFLAGLETRIRFVKLFSVHDPTSVTDVYIQDAEVTNLHNEIEGNLLQLNQLPLQHRPHTWASKKTRRTGG